MKKETALEIIRMALSSYIEDCSGEGTEETEQIEEAWKVIKNEQVLSERQMQKRKIYYTVEKELQGNDGFEETTGNKTVCAYEVVNNKLEKIVELDLLNEDNSKDSIIEELELEPKEVELILL